MSLRHALAIAFVVPLALVGCRSTPPAEPAPHGRGGALSMPRTEGNPITDRWPDAEVKGDATFAVNGSEITISTTTWCAALHLTTEDFTGPEPGSSPTSPATTYRYCYSFYLDNGSVTIKADGSLKLDSGRLYLASARKVDPDVNRAPDGGVHVSADIILHYFPLVTRGVGSAGSTATEWIFAVDPDDTDKVMVNYRSSVATKKSVWTETNWYTSRYQTTVSKTSHIRMSRNGSVHTEQSNSQAQNAAFDALESAAHAAGVQDPQPCP